MSVSVFTASLPERGRLLGEAIHSVRVQTVQPRRHLVGLDYDRVGPATIVNGLVRADDSEWLAFLADDNVLMPHHLETLLAESVEADVVHSAWVTMGRPGWSWQKVHEQGCSVVTPEHNSVDACALVRREAFEAVGGFPDTMPEDWALWLRLKDIGARFKCVHRYTWVYRFHESSWSVQQLDTIEEQ